MILLTHASIVISEGGRWVLKIPVLEKLSNHHQKKPVDRNCGQAFQLILGEQQRGRERATNPSEITVVRISCQRTFANFSLAPNRRGILWKSPALWNTSKNFVQYSPYTKLRRNALVRAREAPEEGPAQGRGTAAVGRRPRWRSADSTDRPRA